MASTLTTILKSINMKTEQLDREFISAEYAPFIVNRILSNFLDTVLLVYEMDNRSYLSKYEQYLYYYTNVRKRSRFAPWHKIHTHKYLDIVMEYYGYSRERAVDALKILKEEELVIIEQKLYKGGIK